MVGWLAGWLVGWLVDWLVFTAYGSFFEYLFLKAAIFFMQLHGTIFNPNNLLTVIWFQVFLSNTNDF